MAESETSEKNIEAKCEKYKYIGTEVYQEYEKQYEEMWSKLNVCHLDIFAKILMEQEHIVLKNRDELVLNIRSNLKQQMQEALQNFWHSNSVSEALISLEMFKEKFKSYEGHKWNMDAKTPWERTRPIRMRFKETRLRYLQAQLNSQNKRLEEVLLENSVLRQHMQEVKKQRIALIDTIGKFRNEFESTKADIMNLQQKILAENDENVDVNIES